ncbi:hypothetical protein K6U06_16425 [Acidiferrimicrobium sp. IK]|uniref:hypothetical protein n=1 Tax=Acidiferrimicrobium sp. IK TaxID=2871700 RepID=UPI0021CB140E|nr:hypothetical protein [Acidiferrimicrobium sp. IK]MCU4185958.1 hypothetical protein [Acidiferrimicrobium sp. IK]
MSISPVSQGPAVAPPPPPPPAAAAAAAVAATSSSVAAQVTPQAVSAAVLQRATGDGDGRTGAAALNDGDAAAQAAALQAKSVGRHVDVKA